jgi:type IV secretory pathway TrbF-like protein
METLTKKKWKSFVKKCDRLGLVRNVDEFIMDGEANVGIVIRQVSKDLGLVKSVVKSIRSLTPNAGIVNQQDSKRKKFCHETIRNDAGTKS